MNLNRTSYSSTAAVPVDLLGAPWVGGVGGDLASHYYRARYYDPRAGRFISEDPIGFEGGPNMYSYVGGDPVSWRDPFGLDPGDPFLTRRGAAVDALKYVAKTKYLGVEHGGLIYSQMTKDGLRYFATDSRTDNNDHQVEVDCIATGGCAPSCAGLPTGATRAGEYHTHPDDLTEFGFEAFSPRDTVRLDRFNKPGPSFLMMAPTGNIFEYNRGGPNPKIPFSNVRSK